jgi:dTMP kinase
MFIVFEWVDGSGKDTQLNKVFEYLWERNKNLQIWKTKEPTDYTTSWKLILKKLKSGWFSSPEEALELYVADREEQTQIRKEILKHSAILCSRFDYTTYAYQWISWISFEKIKQAHNYNNIIIPDITFIFDVNSENIEKRLNNRWWEKEFFENIDFLQKANKAYLQVAEKLKSERKIYIIDANESIEKTFDKVKNVLDKYEF